MGSGGGLCRAGGEFSKDIEALKGRRVAEKSRGPGACAGASLDSQVSWVSATSGK